MYCQKCGHSLPDGANYCHHCGAAQNSRGEAAYSRQSLSKCPSCGAKMVQTADGMSCPYCGTRTKSVESDAVKLEKLRLQREKEEREYQRKEREKAENLEKKLQKEDWAEIERFRFKKEKTRIFAIIVCVFALIMLKNSFNIFILLQLVSFALYFLSGYQVIRLNPPSRRKFFSTIGFLLIIPALIGG